MCGWGVCGGAGVACVGIVVVGGWLCLCAGAGARMYVCGEFQGVGERGQGAEGGAHQAARGARATQR